jgi:hypothetical protein
MTETTFDTRMGRLAAGERLPADEIQALAASPDILSLGMLADVWRRRLHQTQATFLRVEDLAVDAPAGAVVPEKAREIRLTGAPASLAESLRAIEDAKARWCESGRTLTALSWADVERFAASSSVSDVLSQLRKAGLDALSTLPLDGVADMTGAVSALAAAGFGQLRLTVDKAPTTDRAELFLRAAALHDQFACIQALNPLPMTLSAFRPTTGYDDVKMVALARLAAPNIPTVQVDWRRYGPKLAQVALSFGADDIDGVSGSDEAPEGRRRAPLEEIRRNIEAAGFQAVERDGRYAPAGQ